MKLNIGLFSIMAFFFLQTSALGQRTSLIYSSDQGIQQITLNSVQTPVQIVSPKTAGYVTKIDFDFKTNTIYWVEKVSHRIMRAHIDGNTTSNLLIGSQLRPYDIAVDSYGGQLYFTDTTTNQIYVYNLKTDRMVGAVMSERLRKLRSIVLYPEKGLMFWTNVRTKGWLIKMAFMNGKSKKSLVKKALGRPVELAIDSQQERLYWIDSKLKVIEYIGLKDLSARRRKLVTRLSVPSKPVGLVVVGQELMWMDRYFKVILTTDKNDESSKKIVKQHVKKPRGITVIGNNKSEARDHPCINHNCSHLCFANKNGVLNCACPKKMTLNRKDKRTCGAEITCGHGEFRCRRSKECIPHVWRCDGSTDCNDRSDEENCQVCNASQFKCHTGGECVAKTAVCDGKKDCTDWSDEDKCNKLKVAVSCPASKFKCKNGNCIERQWVCDRLDDCDDNSDEQGC